MAKKAKKARKQEDPEKEVIVRRKLPTIRIYLRSVKRFAKWTGGTFRRQNIRNKYQAGPLCRWLLHNGPVFHVRTDRHQTSPLILCEAFCAVYVRLASFSEVTACRGFVRFSSGRDQVPKSANIGSRSSPALPRTSVGSRARHLGSERIDVSFAQRKHPVAQWDIETRCARACGYQRGFTAFRSGTADGAPAGG